MHAAFPIAAFALLLVLTGCVGLLDDGPSTATDGPATDVPSATQTVEREPATGTGGDTATANAPTATDASATPTATPTQTATPTATSRPDLSADNPFGQAVVPVRVNDTVDDGRNTTELVATAIDYWNERIDRYTAFDYRFELADDPGEARVEVRYVEEIESCGREHDERTIGCAPLLDEGRTAPDVAVARIEVHGSNSAVTGTIQHELGHVLGLGHDAEPLVVMGYRSETPVRNATDRAVPWYRPDLSVYVDHDGIDGDRERIDEQVDHALAYYNEGAEGTIPSNVSFTRTDHEPSADIVVSNAERYDCNASDGSTRWLQYNGNIDTDPAPEVYGRAILCLDVDEDAAGWHVGYWLGQSMGLAPEELADPFRDASASERRSDWWE